MPAADKLSIVKEAYASFGRGDLEGLFKSFDENSILAEAPSLPYGGEHRGVSASIAAMHVIGETWTDIGFDIVEIVGGEKLVVAYGYLSATSRATGKSFRFPLAEVWEFEGDTVKRLSPLYFDTAAAIAALT